METFRLIFQQDKISQTSSFDLEGILSSNKEERRQIIYRALVSKEGLTVQVRKRLQDESIRETTVIFRFSFDSKNVILNIYEPETEEQIGFIGSSNINGNSAINVRNYYGEYIASQVTPEPPKKYVEQKESMKKKYEGYGVMKAATACFRLAIEENNLSTSVGFIDLDNIASRRARDIPNIENLSFVSMPVEYVDPFYPATIILTTRIIRN